MIIRIKGLASCGLAFLAFGCATTSQWPEDTPQRCRVETASAQINCLVMDDGRLADCRVLVETPADCGFGPAALEAVKDARTSRPNIGEDGRVTFTLRFRTT